MGAMCRAVFISFCFLVFFDRPASKIEFFFLPTDKIKVRFLPNLNVKETGSLYMKIKTGLYANTRHKTSYILCLFSLQLSCFFSICRILNKCLMPKLQTQCIVMGWVHCASSIVFSISMKESKLHPVNMHM